MMNLLIISFLLLVTTVTLTSSILYRGTLCGWSDLSNNPPILCNGTNRRQLCPSGYTQNILRSGTAYCYTTNTTTGPQSGLLGTICGGLARYPCGGVSPAVKCPTGYIQDIRHVCYKSDPKMEDLSGTFCGVISEGQGIPCNNMPVRRCPQGYVSINHDEEQWHACAKE